MAARNVYDLTGDNVRFEVEVVDPIVDNMGMEVSMMLMNSDVGINQIRSPPFNTEKVV